MVQNVSVIGAGAMGAQIAAVCALAGFDVRVHDIHEPTFEKSMEDISERLKRKVEKGKLSHQVFADSFACLVFEPEVETAVADCDFVIEAVGENLETKRDLFQKINQHAPKHAILVTNSSTMVNSKLADATSRPAQVCNVHFFHPALMVQEPHTSDETVETVKDFARKLNKGQEKYEAGEASDVKPAKDFIRMSK